MTTTPDIHTISQAFATVSLFSRLSNRQRLRLARLTTVRTLSADAVIIREGDTGMSFYMVLSGGARVDRATASGNPLCVGTVGPSGFFGEMALIDDQPRAATVIATEPTVCALLAKWDFQNAIRDDPEIAMALLPVLTQRIRDLDAHLAELGAPSLPANIS